MCTILLPSDAHLIWVWRTFPMRTVNQTQLARQLKLSRTTVSRSLSNHPAIGAETRQRVQALAKKLGYRGTPTRSVRRSREATPITVGVLIGTPLVAADRATFPFILQGIRQRAAIDHFAVDVVSIEQADTSQDAGRKHIFQHIRRANWRGAQLIYPFAKETVQMLTEKLSIVSVLTEYYDHDLKIDVIDTDHGNVGWLVEKLAQLGHRRIGFANWQYPSGGVWAARRFAAYAEELYRQGLELRDEWVLNIGKKHTCADATALADAVAQAVRRDGVTAWVCAADHQAYQLIADLQARGLRVPEDCSVTGYDGNEPPPGLPALSTLRVPNVEIGASAIARLGSRLLQPTSPRRKTLVETAFIPGATIAPPPTL